MHLVMHLQLSLKSADGEQPSFTLKEKFESIEIDSESMQSGWTFRRLSQPALNQIK